MLIHPPESWPQTLVAVVAMVALAVLDLVGAFAAKEAVVQRSPAHAALGATAFLLLFWVYASSLQYADLAPVTFGWVVALQVGVLLLDRFRYEVHISGRAWLAVAVILAGQAYLLIDTSAGEEAGAGGPGVSARDGAHTVL